MMMITCKWLLYPKCGLRSIGGGGGGGLGDQTTVFIWIVAMATINSNLARMQLLIEGGFY